MPSFWKSQYVRQITEILILVLLLAPIPVGHCHSLCDSDAKCQQMTSHLQIYHGGVENAKNWPEDWHVHWVFPSNGEIVAGCSISTVGSHRMVSSCCDDLFNGVFVSEPISWTLCELIYHQSLPEELQHSFLTVALLHSRQSLPELLGIMRC